MFESMIPLLIIGCCTVIAMMFLLWLYQVKTQNASVVDVGWTLGLVLLAGIYCFLADGHFVRRLIIFAMVSLWGARLISLLIFRLIKDKKEDKRYAKIREDWKTNVHFKFLLMFLFQGFLDVVLSIPFLLICLNSAIRLNIFEVLGFLIWFAGILGETLADEQMKRFKENSTNKGKTCQVGLWNYSRHPNYFFEWLTWVGYFVFALGSPYGWISFYCPLLMLYFLLKVSGIPLAEAQALKTRGEEYRRYQETTSMFIPLPKKVL